MGLFDDFKVDYDMGIGAKPEKRRRKSVPTSIKKEVLYKQNYKCAKCGKKLPPTRHFHHKKAVSKGGKNTVSNVIALCPNCHAKIHHRQRVKKANKKARAKKKKKNPWEIDFKPPKFDF